MKVPSCISNQVTLNSTGKFMRSNKLWRRRQQTHSLTRAQSMPVLRKQTDDGSVEEISEEYLYRYTRYRWLCNENENLTMRYRKFDISALIDAAVKAAGNCATSCVELLKCTEGQYNKAFLMTMDNGAQVLAKIPNPNAGPAFYTTASEVATRHFLRTVLNFPVPRIYAYCLDALNPVGAEYIIEEKAVGQPLGTIWHHWSTESKADLVTQLVDLETKLTSVSFRKHGCIYQKKDLENRGLPFHDLEAMSLNYNGLAWKLDYVSAEEFVLGPLTDARLWEGERAAMNLDRGPWSTPLSYMAAMGINELQWAKAYAKPQINPYQSIETPVSPETYISLISRYLQVVPYLSPGPFRTTLSHPDLHLDNLFVDPDTKKITCIIDWQSASVSVPFLQHRHPRMLLSFDRRSSRGRLDTIAEEFDLGESSKGTADLLRQYQNLSMLKNNQRWAALNLHNRSLLTEPVSLLCGAWSRNDVFSFRHALIYLASRWKEIAPSTAPCPLQFTEHELQFHNSELELVEGLEEVLFQLHKDNLIPLGGMVRREDHEQALHANNSVREMFVDMAKSEPQRALYSRIWPYQD